MNIPNILSLFRLALVPTFAVVFFSKLESAYVLAVVIYVVAFLTDILDGYIARKYNLITKLGKILDPAADKLMNLTVLICFSIRNIIPWWASAIILLKECTMAVGGIMMLRRLEDVQQANIFGKLATGVFFLISVILLLVDGISKDLATMLISIPITLAVVAMITYTITYVKAMKKVK